MNHVNDLTYKGHTLSATAQSANDSYFATLVVRAPSGAQRMSTLPGKFPSAMGAVTYAFEYGMATVDCRQLPAND